MNQELSTAEYRCPGESYTISRSVHLGRLSNYHSACRQCPRRGDTAGISARQARRLAEIHSQQRASPRFSAEGIGSIAINEMSPQAARRIAVEFARQLLQSLGATRPAVVVAGDGRLATAGIFAAVVEGIRWAGCEAIDIGPASAPCTACAIEHLAAEGGLLVGNPGGAAHALGMKFWMHGEPLSRGPLLDAMALAIGTNTEEGPIDRPARAFGPIGRFAAADFYLNELRPAYHALRPLVCGLQCTCEPVRACLHELMRNVACRIIPLETGSAITEQVAAAKAHFGMIIEDDGEYGRIFDEQGRAVDADRLAALFAKTLGGGRIAGGSLRQETFRAMQAVRADFAVDQAARLWYAAGHAPLADALRTLTLLLVLLSRGDRALSAVLDRGAAED